MLLQALLDVVVDDALELTEEFRRELDILEGRALVNPDTTAVRHLHVMSGQLLMLKRTLTPLQGMIQSLRHDDERRSAVAKNLRRAGSSGTVVTDEGFISPEAKQYLADVNGSSTSCASSLAHDQPTDHVCVSQTTLTLCSPRSRCSARLRTRSSTSSSTR